MALPQKGTWTLPDGRLLRVSLEGLGGPDKGWSDRRGWWYCDFKDDPGDCIYGSPLPSTLAVLLGYQAADDDWPDWIDNLAKEIEVDLRGKWKASRSR